MTDAMVLSIGNLAAIDECRREQGDGTAASDARAWAAFPAQFSWTFRWSRSSASGEPDGGVEHA
jgi:hypothetical protein